MYTDTDLESMFFGSKVSVRSGRVSQDSSGYVRRFVPQLNRVENPMSPSYIVAEYESISIASSA